VKARSSRSTPLAGRSAGSVTVPDRPSVVLMTVAGSGSRFSSLPGGAASTRIVTGVVWAWLPTASVAVTWTAYMPLGAEPVTR
jgi:hypothetical protein